MALWRVWSVETSPRGGGKTWPSVVGVWLVKPQKFHKNLAVSAVKNTPQLRKMPCSFVFFPLLEVWSLALFKEVSGLGCVHFHASCTCHMSIQATSFDDPCPSENDYLTSRTYAVGSTSNWFKIDSTQTVAYIIPTYVRSTCTIKTSNWSLLSKLQTWMLVEAVLTKSKAKDTFKCHEFRFMGWDYSTPKLPWNVWSISPSW